MGGAVNLSRFEDLTWFEEMMLYGLFGRMLGLTRDRIYHRIHQVALRGMAIAASDNILELGFGTGGLIRMFAAAAPHGLVAGVDRSPRMWEIARRRNERAIRERRVDLRVCDPTLLPWQGGCFDKAIAINSYPSWTAPLEVLCGLYRVLRPGGALILTLRAGSASPLDALKEAGFQHGEVAGRVGSHDLLIAIRANH